MQCRLTAIIRPKLVGHAEHRLQSLLTRPERSFSGLAAVRQHRIFPRQPSHGAVNAGNTVCSEAELDQTFGLPLATPRPTDA
jgi:hypothetical protein